MVEEVYTERRTLSYPKGQVSQLKELIEHTSKPQTIPPQPNQPVENHQYIGVDYEEDRRWANPDLPQEDTRTLSQIYADNARLDALRLNRQLRESEHYY